MHLEAVFASTVGRGVEMASPDVSSWGHLRLPVFSFFLVLLASPSIAVAAADHSTETTPAMVRVTGHVLPALSKATIVPSTSKSASYPTAITLVLKHDDQPAFERYLHELYDPHSKNFHKFLTQRQIAGRRDRFTIECCDTCARTASIWCRDP